VKEQNAKLTEKYDVQGYPKVILLSPVGTGRGLPCTRQGWMVLHTCGLLLILSNSWINATEWVTIWPVFVAGLSLLVSVGLKVENWLGATCQKETVD